MKSDYKLFNKSGIYKITNKINGKFYIGSSCNLYNRLYEHIRYLKLNKHGNPKLQNAFNKYGIENFEWSIITFCNCDYCFKMEQLFFDIYRPEYNIYLKVEMSNRVLSDETKRKIGVKSKQKFIDNPQLSINASKRLKGKATWNKGKTGIYSKETLEKFSKIAKERKGRDGVKINVLDKQMNILYSFNSIAQAMEFLKLSKHASSNISSGIKLKKERYGYFWELQSN